METDPLFKLGTEALAADEWRVGYEILRRCHMPIPTSELIFQPELALIVAERNAHAGYAVQREYQRLIEGRTDENGIDDLQWPTHLADRLFQESLRAVRAALHVGDWDIVSRVGPLLLELPFATAAREAAFEKLFAEILSVVFTEQPCLMADVAGKRRASHRPPSRPTGNAALLKEVRGTLVPFDLPALLVGAAAQVTAYPSLSGRMLSAVLQGAEWPVLIFLDEAAILALWPEITGLYDDRRARRQLSGSGLDWLERALREEPEPYAPDEFMEDPS